MGYTRFPGKRLRHTSSPWSGLPMPRALQNSLILAYFGATTVALAAFAGAIFVTSGGIKWKGVFSDINPTSFATAGVILIVGLAPFFLTHRLARSLKRSEVTPIWLRRLCWISVGLYTAPFIAEIVTALILDPFYGFFTALFLPFALGMAGMLLTSA